MLIHQDNIWLITKVIRSLIIMKFLEIVILGPLSATYKWFELFFSTNTVILSWRPEPRFVDLLRLFWACNTWGKVFSIFILLVTSSLCRVKCWHNFIWVILIDLSWVASTVGRGWWFTKVKLVFSCFRVFDVWIIHFKILNVIYNNDSFLRDNIKLEM